MAFADDYVGVHERIDSLFKKFPDARIQTEIAHLSDNLVVMKATVYRDAADTLPVIAHSQLGIPGKTNFTRDSEVENAETSAVGRALAFMGFETKKGIASREEVASRRPAPADRAYGPPAASQRPTSGLTAEEERDYVEATAPEKSGQSRIHDVQLPEFPTASTWIGAFRNEQVKLGLTHEATAKVIGKQATNNNVIEWVHALVDSDPESFPTPDVAAGELLKRIADSVAVTR